MQRRTLVTGKVVAPLKVPLELTKYWWDTVLGGGTLACQSSAVQRRHPSICFRSIDLYSAICEQHPDDFIVPLPARSVERSGTGVVPRLVDGNPTMRQQCLYYTWVPLVACSVERGGAIIRPRFVDLDFSIPQQCHDNGNMVERASHVERRFSNLGPCNVHIDAIVRQHCLDDVNTAC